MKIILTMAAVLCLTVQGFTQFPLGSNALTIRSIRVHGNETTKAHIILREMTTRVGDTLDLDVLQYDKDRIYSLGLFNRVEIDYSAAGSDADLIVRVHERWYLYPFPVLGFKYRDPRNLYYGLGLIHSNFRGRNEKLMFSFALGFDRWISLVYQNPKLTADDDIYFRASLVSARVQNLSPDRGLYRQKNNGGHVTIGKRFGHFSLARFSAGYEGWSVSDEVAGGTLTPGGRDVFGTLGFDYTYDSRDVREYSMRGSLLFLSATKFGFGESYVDFFRYRFSSSVFLPVLDGASVGARAHGEFSAGGPVPRYRYVYFGYGERIRGYFKRVLEGENIVGGNIELRLPILSPRYYQFPYSPLPEF
ncbi:MAG: hypothetical protein HYW57_09610, partial [Ignavibacteriales bacterium]|nr:hypothetical protein [Ignavibacteriales bacterium]